MLTYTTIKNVPDYELLKTNILNMPIERIQKNIKIFDDFLSSNKKFFVAKNKSARMNRDCTKEFRNFLADAIKSRLPQCVKENETSFVNKKLPSNPLTKQSKKAKFNSLNETNNSKQETKTMTKNTNTLTKIETTANIAQLTEAVNKILERLDALESKNVSPKHEFKKLRETAEEVKKETKKVKKEVKVKTANKEQKAEIMKLQKKAQEMKDKMTKNQLSIYGKLWSKKWQSVNKSIDIKKKDERSMAFAKGRIECAKKAMTLDI